MCFIPLWIICIKYRCTTSVPSLGPHCCAASVQQHHSPGFLSLVGWDDWVGHGWRWRECRNCSYQSFNAPLPCISVSLRGDKPKWSTNCPAGENCKWVKAIKLLCLQVWFCLDRLSFSWPVETCYVDGWCYFMLEKNWDTGTYSVLPYNHFFKFLCCYLELHFFEGTGSEHAAMPAHCSVTGTAVSPPLTCSDCFYKQINSEWVSVVKKSSRKTWLWTSFHLWHPEVIQKLKEDYFPCSPHRRPNLGTGSYCNVLHESMCRMFLKEDKSFWLFFFLNLCTAVRVAVSALNLQFMSTRF